MPFTEKYIENFLSHFQPTSGLFGRPVGPWIYWQNSHLLEFWKESTSIVLLNCKRAGINFEKD